MISLFMITESLSGIFKKFHNEKNQTVTLLFFFPPFFQRSHINKSKM